MGNNVGSHDMLRVSLVSNTAWVVSFSLSTSRRTKKKLQFRKGMCLGCCAILLLSFWSLGVGKERKVVYLQQWTPVLYPRSLSINYKPFLPSSF